VEVALKAGYRHIDGAWMYLNEAEVGQGIVASGVPREEIFLTSKVWNHCHRAEALERSVATTLKDIGVNYLGM
jgi:diketogulonate reductase-like aldo/keto reductase